MEYYYIDSRKKMLEKYILLSIIENLVLEKK